MQLALRGMMDHRYTDWKPKPGAPTTMICNRCGKEYPFTIENFKVNYSSRFGLVRTCRRCSSARADHVKRVRRLQAQESVGVSRKSIKNNIFRVVQDPDEEAGFPSGATFDYNEILEMCVKGYFAEGSILANGNARFVVVGRQCSGGQRLRKVSESAGA